MRTLHTMLLAAACSLAAAAGQAAPAPFQHVLLISVDGMHAIDLTNWIQSHPASNFARLSHHGAVYPNAFTTAPSV